MIDRHRLEPNEELALPVSWLILRLRGWAGIRMVSCLST